VSGISAAPAVAAPAALRFASVSKHFAFGETDVLAVDGVTLEISPGEFTAIIGRSGSGKSTLLNLAAGIDTPSGGEVWVDGHELSKMSDDSLTLLRRETIGVVYQFFHLLPGLSVRENVALPLLLGRARERDALARAEALLAEVGLSARAEARPHTLSGGEMQRAAVARALVHRPRLLLADEPTGNLDSRAAAQVIELLGQMGARHGATVLMVTHSREAAQAARRVIEMRDGRVVADTTS
jgi:ABC-type lipoprotein export system ATPase subunit